MVIRTHPHLAAWTIQLCWFFELCCFNVTPTQRDASLLVWNTAHWLKQLKQFILITPVYPSMIAKDEKSFLKYHSFSYWYLFNPFIPGNGHFCPCCLIYDWFILPMYMLFLNTKMLNNRYRTVCNVRWQFTNRNSCKFTCTSLKSGSTVVHGIKGTIR